MRDFHEGRAMSRETFRTNLRAMHIDMLLGLHGMPHAPMDRREDARTVLEEYLARITRSLQENPETAPESAGPCSYCGGPHTLENCPDDNAGAPPGTFASKDPIVRGIVEKTYATEPDPFA